MTMINPYITVPVVAWVLAQIAKLTIQAIRGHWNWHYLHWSGGMPSAHAAVVVALATTAGLTDGPASHLFGLTVVVAAIVTRDAVISGRHRPNEVVTGAVLGLVIGLIGNHTAAATRLNWLSLPPTSVESWAELVVIIGLLISMGVLWLKWRGRRSPVWRSLLRRCWGLNFSTALLLLLVLGAQYEGVVGANWRLWPVLLLVGWTSGLIWLINYTHTTWRPQLVAEQEATRKQQWLVGKKHKQRT